MANGPIGKPNSTSAPSTSCGSAPSSKKALGLDRARAQHAIADEAVADADDHRHLADAPPEAIAVASVSGAVLCAAHDFKSRMTFAGLKKCMPRTDCGRFVVCAIAFTSR